MLIGFTALSMEDIRPKIRKVYNPGNVTTNRDVDTSSENRPMPAVLNPAAGRTKFSASRGMYDLHD
jgi:hypothetical protein